MFQENLSVNAARKNEAGKTVVIVLVVLVLAAVGALGYLATQMEDEDAVSTTTTAEAVAGEEPAADEAATADTAEDVAKDAETADAEVVEGETNVAEVNVEGQEEPFKIEEGNPVVAKVGGEDVTRVDVLNYIQNWPPQMRQIPLPQLFSMAQEQVINAKIMEKQIDTQALESDEEVQAQLENAKEQIIRGVYLQRELEKKMTDKRITAAYNDFKKEFEQVEEVKARHILVEDEAKAAELIAKLNEGAEFAELAKENSIDGTAANGGELGYFAKADVVPAFANAAFELNKGEYTKEPVKSQFGYHVIKSEDKRKRSVPELEEVKPMLENNLRREIMEEMMQDWRKDAKVEKFDINGEKVSEKESN